MDKIWGSFYCSERNLQGRAFLHMFLTYTFTFQWRNGTWHPDRTLQTMLLLWVFTWNQALLSSSRWDDFLFLHTAAGCFLSHLKRSMFPLLGEGNFRFSKHWDTPCTPVSGFNPSQQLKTTQPPPYSLSEDQETCNANSIGPSVFIWVLCSLTGGI